MHAQTITPPSEMVKPFLDLVVAYGIAGLALLITLSWAFLLFRFNRRLALNLLGAALLIAALAYLADQLGWFLDAKVFPPRFVLVTVPILVFIIALGFSRWCKQMAEQMSISSLITLQVFRLPLELLMLRAALLQVMTRRQSGRPSSAQHRYCGMELTHAPRKRLASSSSRNRPMQFSARMIPSLTRESPSLSKHSSRHRV